MADDPIKDRPWVKALTVLTVKIVTSTPLRWLWENPGGVLFVSKFCIKTKSSESLVEAHTMRFVAGNTSIPVPKVHCAFRHKGRSYIVMEKIEGEAAGRAWTARSGESRRRILEQLRGFVQQLRAIEAPEGVAVANILGGSIYDARLQGDAVRGPFPKMADFHKSLRSNLDIEPEDTGVPEDLRELVEFQKTASSKPILTHGDLSSLNIIVRGDEVAGIIDWETAGWFPDYWEYARAWNANPQNEFWRQEVDRFLTPLPHELRMENIRLKYFSDI